MQIQVIEQKTGLDRATIRYYEQEGLIKPQRLQNGYRNYSERNLEDLLKIKLLRQVGLSIEAIQSLTEGKEELQTTLENQLVVLKEHKAQIDNAEALCARIMQDHVTYETFVPSKYFVMPNQKKGIENSAIETAFTEYVYLESHPVRRFVGRYLDQLLTSAILLLIVVVFMRVRPLGDTQNNLLSISALFLSIPINALFLCLFGTTPGKFAVGIYLKTPEGKNMSFGDALQREWAVFRYGMGFNIPIYNIIRLIKSYNIHTAGRELEWDYKTDVLYTEWGTKRWVYSAILGVICVFFVIFSATDAQFPKHRNEDLTLAQFAENYNDYAKQKNMRLRLSPKGEWYSEETEDGRTTIIIETPQNYEEFWYFITDENQTLERIKVEIKTDSRLFFIQDGKLSEAIFTAIMSQPNADIITADHAMAELSELNFIREPEETKFDFGNVTVNWELQDIKNPLDAQYKVLVDILFS